MAEDIKEADKEDAVAVETIEAAAVVPDTETVESTPPPQEEVSSEGATGDGAQEEPAAATDLTGTSTETLRELAESNEALAVVVNFLDDMKVGDKDIDAAFGAALSSGDPSKVDYGVLEKRLGGAKAAMVRSNVEVFVKQAREQGERRDAAVYEAVGGQDNWTVISDWANDDANVTEADRAELKSMLQSSDLAAKLASAHLAGLYKNSPGTSTSAGSQQEGTLSTLPLEGLTRRDYADKYQEAYSRGASPTELAELDRLRLLGFKRGI